MLQRTLAPICLAHQTSIQTRVDGRLKKSYENVSVVLTMRHSTSWARVEVCQKLRLRCSHTNIYRHLWSRLRGKTETAAKGESWHRCTQTVLGGAARSPANALRVAASLVTCVYLNETGDVKSSSSCLHAFSMFCSMFICDARLGTLWKLF